MTRDNCNAFVDIHVHFIVEDGIQYINASPHNNNNTMVVIMSDGNISMRISTFLISFF